MAIKESRSSVEGCALLGTVGGWEDIGKQNGAYWLALRNHAYEHGDADVRVLVVRGGDDEVYLCHAPGESAAK